MNAPIHVISMSGGKDSTATALRARETVPHDAIRYVFADTGNEHSLVYEYLTYLEGALGITITRLKRDLSPEINRLRGILQTIADGGEVARFKWTPEQARHALPVIKPTGNPFLDLCILKARFPSRRAQFCTQFLKTEPLVEYELSLIESGADVWSWQGIRAEESPRRAEALPFEAVGGGLFINRPILDWTADRVFDAHRAAGIEPNPLYRLGMSRVGCMPCINASKDEVLEIATRFPEVIERIAEWERIVAVASKRGAASFFSAPNDGRGDRVGRNIAQVVQWSKTSRGGKQFDMLRDPEADAPACSSSYGLCE